MWVIIDEPKPAADRNGQLPHIDEALQLEVAPSSRRWRPRVTVTGAAQLLLAVVLLALLPLQYLLQNQSRLLQEPAWRPLYQAMCDIARCTLPPRTDLAAIRNDQLRIASHPINSDYLQVDMQLFNGASFPQPFPVLELTFSDIHGQVVTASSLQPLDYLPAAGLPATQPLAANSLRPLTLTLLNPGDHAVNYQLALSASTATGQPKLRWRAAANEAQP